MSWILNEFHSARINSSITINRVQIYESLRKFHPLEFYFDTQIMADLVYRDELSENEISPPNSSSSTSSSSILSCNK